MKKSFFTLLLIANSILLQAQTSSQTFGSGTGSHISGTSTAFIPNPSGSGTTYVRVGTGSGSVNLQSALVSPAFGNGSIIRAEAPTSASVNKVTPILSYTASNQFYTKFDILLGNSSGGNTGAVDGTWFFFQGEGVSYSDANGFTGAQVFTGLQMIFGAGGTFTANYRNGASWTLLTAGNQGTKYTIEIMGNNSASTINYTYGTAQSVVPNTYDLWVNGVLAGNDLNKGQLPALANVSALMFYGISSTSNAANLFTDNISVSNAIPSLICTPFTVTANVTPSSSVCSGSSISLSGSGANTYTWTNGLSTPSNGVAFPPASSSTYTVTGSDANGCTGTSTISITVNPIITGTASASPTTICLGSSATLNGNVPIVCGGTSTTFAGTYAPLNWTATNINSNGTVNTGGAPTNIILSSGTNASTTEGYTVFKKKIDCAGTVSFNWSYSTPDIPFSDRPRYRINSGTWLDMTGYNMGGASSQTGTQSISVAAGDTISIAAYTFDNDLFACNVTITNFSAPSAPITGFVNYWDAASGGTLLGAVPLNATPISAGTSTYYAQFNSSSPSACTNPVRTAVSVTVNALPIVTASPISQSLCQNGNTSIAGGGAATYTWTGGISNNTPFTVTSTETYTVTGTDANMCSNTTTAIVNMYLAPTVTATPSSQTLCQNAMATISGGGAANYTWTGGISNATPFAVTSSMTYTVTGTDANLCSNTATAVVNMNTLPTVNTTPSNQTLCQNEMATLAGNGAISYSWTGGISNATAFTVTSTMTYTVTGTDANLCSNTATAIVNMNTLPMVTASPSTQTWCQNEMATITGGGAPILNWTGGISNATPFAVNSTMTYTVTGTDANLCSNTATAVVNMNPLPLVTASPFSQTLCENELTTLNGGGASTYTWSGGILNNTPFNVNSTAIYTVTGTDANLCTNTATAIINMNLNPLVIASISPAITCNNTVAIPTAGGALNYVWTGGILNGEAFIATTGVTTYTVTGTDGNFCTTSSTVILNVNPSNADISNSGIGNSSSTTGTSNYSQPQPDGSSVSYYDANCKLIAQVEDALGGNVLGNTTATVNVEATVPLYNGQPYVRRWYEVTPTNNGPATITLFYTQADFDNYNAVAIAPYLLLPTGPSDFTGIANVRITKVSGILGIPSPFTSEVITPNMTWDAINQRWSVSFPILSFSQFYLHSANSGNVALPVNITNFSGRKVNSSNRLEWTTSSESNNAYFNIEHSQDGMNFNKIGSINSLASNGNSSEIINYQFEHMSPSLGHNYYRLTQVDIDMKSSINQKIVDIIWTNNNGTLTIYPNPIQEVLNIDLYANKIQNVSVHILDMSGRKVKKIETTSQIGLNQIKMNLNGLASGIYTVQLFENNQLSQVSNIKKHD